MTKGPIAVQLILFALPLLGSSLIQQMYNTVDLIFVGQLLGKEASAAVGASSMLVTCLVGFFTGMSIGSSVVAAHFFGAGNYADLKRTVHTAIAISLGGGLALMVFGIALAPVFLGWMNTPDAILRQATGYIRIYFLSLVPMISYNVGAGILRALGDSKSPMLYQLVGGLSNVGANTLFIWALNLGVNGASIATLFSQVIASALVLRHLRKLDDPYRLRWSQIRLNGDIAKSILKIGIPSGVQATATTFSNLFIQYHINSLGVDTIAAFTAYFRVELFIYLPIMAFSQAATTFTGQNFGADRLDRVKKGTKTGILVGICFTAVLSLLTLQFSRQVFGFFTPDDSVINMGMSLARIAYPFYFLYVFLEVFASTIRGAAKAVPPMLIVLVNMCGARLVLLNIFMFIWHSPQGIVLIYPVTWLITALCMAAYYHFGKWLPSAQSENLTC
jgi:putative MATE family efflux protein